VATYTPKSLINAKAMGNGSANITTWQYNNTGTVASVARTLIFTGQAGATGQVNVEIGVTGATAIQNQRIIDSYVLTAAIPYQVNGWFDVDVNYFLSGFANSTTVTGSAYGVLAS
jgi:hypothetical protein